MPKPQPLMVITTLPDADAAGRLATALVEAGLAACGKHFPGHGDTRDDSHGTLPVIDVDLDTLEARDLAPYRTLIAGGVPAVMLK